MAFLLPGQDKCLFLSANGIDSRLIFGKYIWTWHPWLQHYVTLAGILIFGNNLWGTRLFFALCGVLSVILLFKTSTLIFQNKLISFLLSLQLIFLLPFFLYSRQARYYSLSSFFSLCVFYLLVKYIWHRLDRNNYILFFVSLLLLFFSNYLIWLSCLIVVFIVLLIKRNKILFTIIIVETAFAIFWFLIFRPYNSNVFMAAHSLTNIPLLAGKSISYINAYLFPLILVPIIFFLGRKKFSKFIYLVSIWMLVHLSLVTVFLVPHGRYIIHLAPILVLLYGVIYYFLRKKNILFLLLLSIFFISTSILNTFPLQIINHYVKEVNVFDAYKIELTKKYQTYLPILAGYFKKNYHQGDLYLGSYSYAVYLDSKVPFFSLICDGKTGQYTGPRSITNKDNIRWIYFADLNQATLNTKNQSECFVNLWKQIADKYVLKKLEVGKNVYNGNDSDIVSRAFPPTSFNQKYIYFYEKK